MDKKYILEKLSKIDKKEFSVLEIGLFGSYAKNEATENSDIDILVKMEFNLMGKKSPTSISGAMNCLFF